MKPTAASISTCRSPCPCLARSSTIAVGWFRCERDRRELCQQFDVDRFIGLNRFDKGLVEGQKGGTTCRGDEMQHVCQIGSGAVAIERPEHERQSWHANFVEVEQRL